MKALSDNATSGATSDAPRAAQPTARPAPRLSICIATFKRGPFIGATLESIVPQLDERCELVVVDGASPDETEQVVRRFAEGRPAIRYVRETTNSGVDQDYDKAVGYATGDFCWLMTDDDLLVPGAVRKVLDALEDEVDLVVVNAQVRTLDLSGELKANLLDLRGRTRYGAADGDALFADVGRYLSFIGGVVIRRSAWLARQRTPYFGSLFIHIGVIFQSPTLACARLIREPLIVIRYGNAMWTARTFEIWMFKWPGLVWSFEHLSRRARQTVTRQDPYRDLTRLLWFRSTGGYTVAEYVHYLRPRIDSFASMQASLVARLPERFVNALCGLYCWTRLRKPARMAVYDLANAAKASAVAKSLARHLQIQ